MYKVSGRIGGQWFRADLQATNAMDALTEVATGLDKQFGENAGTVEKLTIEHVKGGGGWVVRSLSGSATEGATEGGEAGEGGEAPPAGEGAPAGKGKGKGKGAGK